MRTRRWALPFLALILVCGVVLPLPTAAGAASQNEILITVLYDGTETDASGAFDTDPLGSTAPTGAVPEPHTPGLDAGPQNLVVKTYDSFAVRVDWNINEEATTDAVLRVELPSYATWSPDATGMFAGCDPAASSFPDPQTLVCSLGDQAEGSNGTIRPVASLQFENDSESFNITSTLTTADDATGVVDLLDQPLTVSEAPKVDWVKAQPEVFGPVTDSVSGDSGYVFLYPLTLADYHQNDQPITGMGPINDSVPIDFFDHAWGLVPSATIATASQMTAAGAGGRNVCGAYDGAGAFPVTSGAWTCSAPTSPNGYPVVSLGVSGHTTVPAPALNADGTPNEGPERRFADGLTRNGPIVIAGQIAFWLPEAEVQAEVSDDANDSPTSALFYNSIATDSAATVIAGEADVGADRIAGSTGTTAELATITGNGNPPANNTVASVFGIGVVGGSPGATIGHDIKWTPGPLALIETDMFGLPRFGGDFRTTAQGGPFWLPGSTSYHGRSSAPGDFIGQTPRGATVTIDARVFTSATPGNGTIFDAPPSGCVAFDTAHYSLTSFGDITVTQLSGGASVNDPIAVGGYSISSNTGPLAHVYTGEARTKNRSWRGQGSALGGETAGISYVVEFTDAPIEYHAGSSFGVDDDQLTCNNDDDGPSGWVDATTGDLSVFDTENPGDGVYEGITRARIRITERMPWASSADEDRYHGFTAYFQAEVKADLAVQTVNQELMALMSHSFGDVDANGTPDMAPYVGADPRHCSPYSQAEWELNTNDIETTTNWCNHEYHDDGIDSFDTTDLVDWDNRSWTESSTSSTTGVVFYQDASGTVIRIVEAALSLSKENLDGLADVKDNGQLVQFEITPSVVGSNLEALTNVTLSDNLPSYYEFVRFVSTPTSPGATCAPPSTPTGTISCRFSEANPAVDTGPLPAGLPGGWSDSFIIEVRVTGAIANPDYPVQLTNTASLSSSGLGPWDPSTETFSGDVAAASKSRTNSASSYMPLPADQGAIIKAVDTLEGPCLVHPTEEPAPAGWESRCSTIGHDDNMSFVLSLTNEGNSAFTGIEIVDVFPHNADGAEPDSGTNTQGGSTPTQGDGRTPPSNYTGSLGFVSMDAVSNAPGLVTWVTGDDPTTISRDPAVTVGAAANTWCDAPGGTVQVGTGSCPATAADVTGTYSTIDGPLNPSQTTQIRLTLDAEDSTCGDHYTNTFGARVPQILLPIRSNDVSIMVECEVDLALEKVVDPAFVPGADWLTAGTTTVDFLIEVTNQGDPVEDFDITDYVDTTVWSFEAADNPAGTSAGSAALPYTWDDSIPGAPVVSLDGRFDDGETVIVPVTLTLQSTEGPFENRAEISYFDVDGDPSNGDSDPANPDNPASGPLTDTDSTPDGVDGNGPGEDLAADMVDGELTEDGTAGGDEDDHDIAVVPVYDLELVKITRDPVDITTDPWEATFEITVTNQGNQPAYLVDITEYAPAGLTFDPASTAALWAAESVDGVTAASPVFTIAGPIAPGESIIVPIVFDIVDLTQAPYRNAAEISAFDADADPANAANPFAVDVDSTPDGSDDDDVIDHLVPNYDPDGDGDLNEPTVGDEDDHDISGLTLPLDLALRKRVDPADPDLADGIQNGDQITFFIEVFNQGGPIEDFHVTDYIADGWIFDPAANPGATTTAGSLGGPALPFTWDASVPSAPVAVVDGALAPVESVIIPIVLTVSITSATSELFNSAEISYFDNDGDPTNGDSDPTNPDNPASGPLVDVDSNADSDGTNDVFDDDVIDENSVTGDANGSGTVDEDDHDVASTKWWDLALIKERSASQPYVLDPGGALLEVSFDITVKNQGPEDATSVTVFDTPPAGLTFSALTDASGTVSGPAADEFTISSLDAGDSVTFTVTYTIDLAALETPSINTAEISGMQGQIDPDGPAGPLPAGVYDVADIDSVPDRDPTNDAISPGDLADGAVDPNDSHNNIDNDPEGDGLHDADGIDEDDHDTEAFTVPFDLALVKTFVAVDSPLIPGGTATMLITVVNQGPPVEAIDVVDYLDPASWAGFEVGLNPDGAVDASSTAAAGFSFAWDDADPANPLARITADTPGDKLLVGESVAIPIVVRVAADFDPSTPLVNVAEISRFDSDNDTTNGDSNPANPNNPATGPLVDVDSTPDATNASGPGETIGGDLVDDDTTGNGTAGGDEDDHDIVLIPVMDLALRKSVDPSTEFPVFAGVPVTFALEIINQGNVDVSDVTLIDYVDPAMWEAFDAAINPAGTSGGDAAVAYSWAANGQDGDLTIDGTVAPGQTITVPVTLVVAAGADLESLSNVAELTGGTATVDDDGDPATPPVEVTNPDGSTVVDADSTPDSTNDDPLVDDEIGGSGGDEDDHDIALVEPPTYSLGNQVWADTNNDGQLDADESPIPGVTVELFTDADGDGLPDDTNGDGIVDSSDAVASTVTGADGDYLFDDLAPGDYVVGIPPSMWSPGGPLYGSVPSAPVSTDPNDDVDGDNNGAAGPFDYVWSGPVTLDDAEPTNESGLDNDSGSPDVLSNLTVDFGFWMPVFDLALTKTLADGQSTTVTVGDDVTYTITVINQGDLAATDIMIVDYLPAGSVLDDADWTLQADGSATTVLSGPLAAGESATVDITVQITDAGTLVNSAEISDVTPLGPDGQPIVMPNGEPLPDVDSVSDATNDDEVVDDVVDGASGDEDDHDIAEVSAEAGTLASTGSNTLPLVLLGLLLLAGGWLVLMLRRRRLQPVEVG